MKEKDSNKKKYYLAFCIGGLLGLVLGGCFSLLSLIGNYVNGGRIFQILGNLDSSMSANSMGYVTGFCGCLTCCPVTIGLVFGFAGVFICYIVSLIK